MAATAHISVKSYTQMHGFKICLATTCLDKAVGLRVAEPAVGITRLCYFPVPYEGMRLKERGDSGVWQAGESRSLGTDGGTL
jgi:hypothetical protein